jgi:NAD(P)-dependent dehydrogenase (short-subunit alcohol dehydrogenase family)
VENQLTALVTGSSTGFGYVTSTTLARRGHHVFASMRHVDTRNATAARSLRELAGQEGLPLRVIDLDVCDEDSVAAAVESVIGAAGRIDVLVNNAGAGCHAILETVSIDQVRDLFDTNVYSVLRMNRAVLPHMRARGSGLLVHISSGLARYVLPFYGVYASTKAAVELIAETSRYELNSVGVDSVIVEPGPYGTQFFANAEAMRPADEQRATEYGEIYRLSREMAARRPPAGDPAEVAEAVADLIDTPFGRRPLRTTVGPIAHRADPLNVAAAELQRMVFEPMGLAGLLTHAPAGQREAGGAR